MSGSNMLLSLFVISDSKLAFPYSKLAFLTRNSLLLLETRFSYSKLTFATRNSLLLLETRFSYSKLTFLTRNSLFLLETRYSKLTFLTRNSLFQLETHFFNSKLAFLTRNSLLDQNQHSFQIGYYEKMVEAYNHWLQKRNQVNTFVIVLYI